ncbi:MAG: TlyA family RNA methyltransferase [bacterium]
MSNMNELNRLDLFIKNEYNLSRDYSKEVILKGLVYVDGNCVKKPAFNLLSTSVVNIDESAMPKFVSRAGTKLEKAINYFQVDLNDKICLDIGASTGGFTDCMLQNNAKKILAVDVGTSQLHEKIKSNDKVICIENTDIRNFEPLVFLEQDLKNNSSKINFICVDVSFISVLKIIESIVRIINSNGSSDLELIILIKPQFEVGKEHLSKGGIVKSNKKNIKAISKSIEAITSVLKEKGIFVQDVVESPIKGSKGNTEYLAYFKK